jgi:hypothetical protein
MPPSQRTGSSPVCRRRAQSGCDQPLRRRPPPRRESSRVGHGGADDIACSIHSDMHDDGSADLLPAEVLGDVRLHGVQQRIAVRHPGVRSCRRRRRGAELQLGVRPRAHGARRSAGRDIAARARHVRRRPVQRSHTTAGCDIHRISLASGVDEGLQPDDTADADVLVVLRIAVRQLAGHGGRIRSARLHTVCGCLCEEGRRQAVQRQEEEEREVSDHHTHWLHSRAGFKFARQRVRRSDASSIPVTRPAA